jgi:putative ATPase
MMSKIPLAERLRPQILADIIGQEHLTGPTSFLQTALMNRKIPSIIFWGPPSVGKTTIANVIANTLNQPFFSLSAISAGVKDIRDAIDAAQKSNGAILFIDEIHRFNKGQQDALLGAVEKGIITLIGATTENPSFEVNSALLSRCQVYILKALEKNNLILLMNLALQKDVELKKKKINLLETEALINISGGDARKLLNLLELVTDAAINNEVLVVTNERVMKTAQQRTAIYDKKGEQHYDIISAFIKSMRGSDPNAAVYWLARMIDAGEDVKFIARRMVIFASEDIGNANANALLLATNTFQSVNIIGYPEGRIILSQCAVYLATSVKSNASYVAISQALSAVKQYGDLPVPLHLRNAPTNLMKNMNYGKDYKYALSYTNNFVNIEYLPEKIIGTKFYEPGKNAREEEIRNFLKVRWKDKYDY